MRFLFSRNWSALNRITELECKVVPVLNGFHSFCQLLSWEIWPYKFLMFTFSIYSVSRSQAYFKIAWESIDRMLVLPNWSLSPVNFEMHAYLFKSMWKKPKENLNNLSFYPYLPHSTGVWARSSLESLTVYLKIYFLLLSGVLVERRLSGKGSENPATDFWWWSIHNWITHPVWRLPF